MDGTFKTAPELFFQLYTIYSCTANRLLPCVYALLPNKQQATYTIFFEILKQLQHTLAPTNLMVDFEIAILNAIDTSFPGTNKSYKIISEKSVLSGGGFGKGVLVQGFFVLIPFTSSLLQLYLQPYKLCCSSTEALL